MKANPSTEMGDGLLSLCWNNHRSTFCHVISTLREKERFSDVTLACEGRYYPVHKLVLSVCSDYFDSMLERTPCKHPVIVLRDVQPDDLEALLSYMYEGIVSVAQNDLARLIKTAEMLRIKGLAVPDDPVPSGGEPKRQSLGGNSQSPSRSGRESRERSSPSAKRRRKEDSGCSRESSQIQSTNDTTDISSLSPHDSYDANSNSRSRTNNREPSHIETKQEVMQSHDDIEEVIVPETLVKQEIEESDSIQKSDSSSLLGGYNVGDSSHIGSQQSDHSVLSHRYDDGAEQQHSQPLEEAVAEALAGPSGMQTWLGAGELNNSSFTTVDAYSTESGDVGGQQLGQQQMAIWSELKPDSNGNRGCFCGFLSKNKRSFMTHQMLHQINSFKCPECPHLSKTKQGMEFHRDVMHSNAFVCTICDFTAKNQMILNQHVSRDHKKCYICQYESDSPYDYEKHLKSHDGKNEAEEEEEEEEVRNFAEPEISIVEGDGDVELDEDQIEHIGEANHKRVVKGISIETGLIVSEGNDRCPMCNFATNDENRMRMHISAHDVLPTRTCSSCPYQCISFKMMKDHSKSHLLEGPENYFHCSKENCNYRTKSIDMLTHHEIRHATSKKYKCNKCPFSSQKRGLLLEHSRDIHGPMPYSCDLCDFSSRKAVFVRMHRLQNHKNVKLLIQCKSCDYRCKTTSLMKQHARIHTGEKPYACTKCPYRGVQQVHLQQHMRNHDSANPHICKICHYAAASEKYLLRHVKSDHGDRITVSIEGNELNNLDGGDLANNSSHSLQVEEEEEEDNTFPIEMVNVGDDSAEPDTSDFSLNQQGMSIIKQESECDLHDEPNDLDPLDGK